jgi:hypothetical protein
MSKTVADVNEVEIYNLSASEEDLIDFKEFSWGQLYNHTPIAPSIQVVVHKYLYGSDYAGSTVEYANYMLLKKEWEDHKDVWFLFGGYGTFGIAIRSTCSDPEIIEVLEKLNLHQVYNEDKMTEIEMNIQDKEWESLARDDFMREVCKMNHIEDYDLSYSEGCLRTVFETAADRANVYWESECGPSMYIDVKEVAKHIELGTIEEIIGSNKSFITIGAVDYSGVLYSFKFVGKFEELDVVDILDDLENYCGEIYERVSVLRAIVASRD